MAMTATLPSEEVQAKARTLLEMRAQWSTVRDKRTGWRRVIVPSLGDEVGVRYVDPAGRCCSCDAGRRGLMCYHRLAVTEALHRDALAAWVADQDQDRAAVKRYEDLVPTCQANGCDEDPEPHSDFCFRHQLVDAF